MRTRRRKFRWAFWTALPLVLLVGGGAGAASACNVPVFRYALENWHAAPYRLTLVHRGPLDEAAEARVGELLEHAEAAATVFDFRKLDPADAADTDQALIAAASKTSLPALVLQYPQQFGQDDPCWAIPWDADAVAKVADSPLRNDLVRRLAAGETAVWLVLQSGDREQDDAAASMLTAELARLEKELKLPDPAQGEVTGERFVGLPLKVKFSILPVARQGADEALVAMLLGSEPDLAEFAEPLVFPVFGRGRALFALVGAGITPQNVAEYGEFLVGACSCQVKEQNPGFDLLLTTDWEIVFRDAGVPASSVEPATPPASAAPELVPIPRGSGASPTDSSKSTPPTTQATPKVTPAAATSAAEAPPPSERVSIARRAAPWFVGVLAVSVIVVAALFWRRKTAAKVRP